MIACTQTLCVFLRLQQMMENLLLTVKGTDVWNSVPFEFVIEDTVKLMQVENGENTSAQHW